MENMNRSDIHEPFLQLVRLGIGHNADPITEVVDWGYIKTIAKKQGLTALVLDGIDKLNTNQPNSTYLLPLEFKLEWIGDVLQNYEQRYEQYKDAISGLAGFYNQHGFKMMVLKGYACGLNWPKPNHRPYGDIDIWQFGQQKEADAALAASSKFQDSGSKVDNSHHHHSVFNWGEFMVENHYDFINVYHHKSNRELEAFFKHLGKDDTHYVEVKGEKLYLPSSNLHALFLLKHTMNDFTSFSMALRQLLDWAFFVEKHTCEIDWKWLFEVLTKYHMMDFFNIVNAICVEELGFKPSIFHSVQFKPELKEKVLKDILEPEFTVEEPSNMIPRLIYKYKRWKGNAWKHELCYQESMWSSFWYGVWGHLLKPASI